MRHPHAALLLLAALAGCAVRGPQPISRLDPSCRATLQGSTLTTVIDFPNGSRLEGLWFVLGLNRADPFDNSTTVADLLLDNLTQMDSLSGRRAIPIARTLRLRSEARSPAEAVQNVADTWCSAMVEAARRGLRFDRVLRMKPGVIAFTGEPAGPRTGSP